uniref:Uncharacterized protein n=1 Tax=Aegilops tauschii subsp. strangulata TaxID=200361 RepID=A0A453GU44_AEGTS
IADSYSLICGCGLLLEGLGSSGLLLGLLPRGAGALLGEQRGVDVGHHAAVGDGDAGKQPAELRVALDGDHQVARDDAGLLAFLGCVASELQDLGGEVLEDGGEVDRGAGADALRVAALLEVAPDAADGELEPGPDGAGDRLLPRDALPAGHLAASPAGGERYSRCGERGCWIGMLRA